MNPKKELRLEQFSFDSNVNHRANTIVDDRSALFGDINGVESTLLIVVKEFFCFELWSPREPSLERSGFQLISSQGKPDWLSHLMSNN